MVFHVLALVLSGILCFADYITEHIFSKRLRQNRRLVSFSAGVAVSYIVLDLFPEIASNALIDGRKIFVYALLGFVALNLIEQYIYKRIGNPNNIRSYRKRIHVAYFFLYNLFIGIVLVGFAAKGLIRTLLFFVPFLLYIIVEILPQEFEFKSSLSKVFYSMAPFFGAIFGISYADFAASVFGQLIAFITGTLLYIVIRESLPSDEAEKPLYFIIGVSFYASIIFMAWNLA